MQKKWNSELESKQELEMKCEELKRKLDSMWNEKDNKYISLRESLAALEKEVTHSVIVKLSPFVVHIVEFSGLL